MATPLPGPSHLQNLFPKCKILNVFGLDPKQTEDWTNLFFTIGFQILKIYFFPMAPKTGAKCDSNGIKTITKKPKALGGFGPRFSSAMRLSYISLLTTSPNLESFLKNLSFGLNPSSKNFGYVPNQARGSDRPLILRTKTPFFRKFLITLLRVICSPPTPIKNLGYAYA